MAEDVGIRDISLPGSGQRLYEVELGPELVLRIVLGDTSDDSPPPGHVCEQLLAAALAVEVAEQIELPTPAVIEVRVPRQPGAAVVSVFPAPVLSHELAD